MEMDQTNRKLNKEDKMEGDRTVLIRRTVLGNLNPPPREEAKWKDTKYKAKRHGLRTKGYGIHQERDGEDGHRHTTVAFHNRCSIFPASKQAHVSNPQ